MDHKALLQLAEQARKNAYAPYSGFTGGAALLTKEGRVYTGCNIENATYGATVCAERTALFSAVSQGERRFCAIAVSGGKAGKAGGLCPPCGICRQVMAEFCDKEFTIVLGNSEAYQTYTLAELLPLAFSLDKND